MKSLPALSSKDSHSFGTSLYSSSTRPHNTCMERERIKTLPAPSSATAIWIPSTTIKYIILLRRLCVLINKLHTNILSWALEILIRTKMSRIRNTVKNNKNNLLKVLMVRVLWLKPAIYRYTQRNPLLNPFIYIRAWKFILLHSLFFWWLCSAIFQNKQKNWSHPASS